MIKIFINEDKKCVKQTLFNWDKPCDVGNDLVKLPANLSDGWFLRETLGYGSVTIA